MADIFYDVLDKMASGENDGLYGDLAFSIDHPLNYNGLSGCVGSFSVYSHSKVDVMGHVSSLHPAVVVKTDRFQGNSTIAYEILPGNIGSRENDETDGILITYNGGECIIPLKVIKAEIKTTFGSDDHAKVNTEKKVRKDSEDKAPGNDKAERLLLMELTRFNMDRIAMGYRDEEPSKIGEVQTKLQATVTKLIRLHPECLRYQLYDALCLVKSGDTRRAARLEAQLKSQVSLSKQKHATDYCLLLMLQFLIAKADGRMAEAESRRNQLLGYINNALMEEAGDPALPVILGNEELGLVVSDTESVYNAYVDLYHDGNNSPYLFFYAGILLMDTDLREKLREGMDEFATRSIWALVRRGVCDEEFAYFLAGLRPDSARSYHISLYKKIYAMHPSRELLKTLCMILIRQEVNEKSAFIYYNEAVSLNLMVARLQEYYVMSLTEDYDKPMQESIMRYFMSEDRVRASLMVKLCLNAHRFYQDQYEIYGAYEKQMKPLVLSEIEKDHITMDLALLANEVLEANDISSALSHKLLPLIFMMKLKADVSDGTAVAYESGIYNKKATGVFYDKKCYMEIPPDMDGKFILLDAAGKKRRQTMIEHISVISNEELRSRIRYLCADSPAFKLQEAYSLVKDHEAAKCDGAFLFALMDKEELSDAFKMKVLDYLVTNAAKLSDSLNISGLIRYAGHMSALEMAGFVEVLIRKRFMDQAGQLLPMVSWDLIDSSLLSDYVRAEIFESVQEEILLSKLIIYLLSKDMASHEMLSWYCEHANGTRADLVTVYQVCELHQISQTLLKERLLLRLIMEEDADLALLQKVFASLEGLTEEILFKAALSRICSGYLRGACNVLNETINVIHSSIIRNAGYAGFPLCVRLACIKHEYEEKTDHTMVRVVLEEMMVSSQREGIYLDFLSGLLSSWGLENLPVITANLSAFGHFGTDVIIDKENASGFYGEYMVEGSEEIYKVALKHMFDCFYSGEIIRFPREEIRYRFVCGDLVTNWYVADPWEGIPSSEENGLSFGYEKLEAVSKSLASGQFDAGEFTRLWILKHMISANKKKF